MSKIILIFLLLPNILLAKSTVYVSDQVEIPIRVESNSRSPILKMLPSGEQLELLKNTKTGWTQIKTNNGLIGWISSRYLINDEPAILKLIELNNIYNANVIKYQQQTEHLKKVEKTLQENQIRYKNLAIEQAKTNSKIKYIEQTYENSLQIEHENQQLNSKILQLNSKIQILEKNNTYNTDQSNRNWFIVGSLVFAFGVILGTLLVNIFNKKNKKKYY